MSLVTCDEDQRPVVLKAAFRCEACGHLVPAAHAGELERPISCPVCGGGQVWDRGAYTLVPDNWRILADCTPEELAEFGLVAADVCRHDPKQPANATVEVGVDRAVGESRSFTRELSEAPGTQDRVEGRK